MCKFVGSVESGNALGRSGIPQVSHSTTDSIFTSVDFGSSSENFFLRLSARKWNAKGPELRKALNKEKCESDNCYGILNPEASASYRVL